jgi:hypothetical protein
MTSPGESQAEPVTGTGVGIRPVRPGGIVILALVILGLLVFAVYCLIAVWPVKQGVTGPMISHVAGIRMNLDQEQRLFVVVAVTGALGGLIHSARSLKQIFTTLLASTPQERDQLPPGTGPAGDVSPPRS